MIKVQHCKLTYNAEDALVETFLLLQLDFPDLKNWRSFRAHA